MHGYRNSVGGLENVFSHHCISQRANGSNCFSRVSLQKFLKKSIANSDFPAGVGWWGLGGPSPESSHDSD